ncbi:hypothetical protein [Celeribacter naphthalenivorans]|uniref:hypothetical protein n=1 Tax=Celeribacter naphthalenivorans TaxID=1614694 RepID=UPI001CF9CF6F|nr:hypothetical protein [Celeribacter naphthalenivorans]
MIEGNVLTWSKEDVLGAMSGGIELDPPRYLHVTISMPPGLRLERTQWGHVFRTAFRHLGLAIQRLPYFIWQHQDTDKDHADAMLALSNDLGPSAVQAQFAQCRRVAALRKHYSTWLLLFGNAGLFDAWLERRDNPDVGEERLTGGTFAGGPENCGFPEGSDD